MAINKELPRETALDVPTVEQRQRGNISAARASRREAWERLRQREGMLPQEVRDVLSRAQELGINTLEAYFLPKLILKENADYPGWKVKPRHWHWKAIREGDLDKDTAKLEGIWVLIDSTQKPKADDGKQLYDNDPFGDILARLRKEGKIIVPSSYEHVPQTSRFAISWDELHQHVLPELAKLLGVKPEQVRLPKEIEFNVIGNLFHPEWGKTNTSEWFEDRIGGSSCLAGGGSAYGGLAGVGNHASNDRYGSFGFRPLVVFSSEA